MEAVQIPGRFLAGIAGLIRNGKGQYLMMKRMDRDFSSGVWECVTGRVNQGEGFEDALYREVKEETGLEVRIDMVVSLTHFYRGEARPENELQGVTFGCSIVGDECVVASEEHSEIQWMSGPDARGFLTADDPGTRWFRGVIERAEVLYAAMPEPCREVYGSGMTV